MSESAETGFTASGLCGHAASGSSAERSISMTSSYTASSSEASAFQSASRPCAFKNASVMSSEGKTEVVAPSSVPMFVIVARSGTVSVRMPGPP